MSSILKALRKIEEEKRVASHAAPDLRMDHGNTSKRAWPFLPLLAGIALGAVCVSLVFFWPSLEAPQVASDSSHKPIITEGDSIQSVPPAIVPEEKSPNTSSEKSQAAPVQDQVAAPIAETLKVREVVMPAEAIPVAVSQVRPKDRQPKVVSEINTRPPEVVEPKVSAKTMVTTTKPGPLIVLPKTLPDGIHLNVSETFLHEDPVNSMAVVNDLPVMLGTFVDSAMVLEIHEDKVTFKIDDNLFDVPVTPQM